MLQLRNRRFLGIGALITGLGPYLRAGYGQSTICAVPCTEGVYRSRAFGAGIGAERGIGRWGTHAVSGIPKPPPQWAKFSILVTQKGGQARL